MYFFKYLVLFFVLMQYKIFAIENNFSSSIESLSAAYQNQFIKEKFWNEDCPVKLSELSNVKVTYWGIDEKLHQGEIIIHKQLANEVVNIFHELFLIKFPIYEMKPYQFYKRAEYAERNDTVGFYCSPAQDSESVYSTHAYAIAIDINPFVNPYYDSKQGWWPKGSDKYSDRTKNVKGIIRVNEKVFNIFTKYGWTWGGVKKETDYMHFSKGMSGNYIITGLKYVPDSEKILDHPKKVTTPSTSCRP
jgi:hypothetical protein